MQHISFIFRLIKNKYVLALTAFVVWLSFFDHNDLFTQWERKKELQKLEGTSAYYEGEINSTKKELANLENDPAVLEKFARENFYLKKPEEQVFIIVDSTVTKN
jgi:cell division protein DivIC